MTRSRLKQGRGDTLTQIVSGKKQNDMAYHVLGKLTYLKNGYYISQSYIATDGEVWGGPKVPREVKAIIRENPKKHWLVNIDLHN